jgi:hypothetical protein
MHPQHQLDQKSFVMQWHRRVVFEDAFSQAVRPAEV